MGHGIVVWVVSVQWWVSCGVGVGVGYGGGGIDGAGLVLSWFCFFYPLPSFCFSLFLLLLFFCFFFSPLRGWVGGRVSGWTRVVWCVRACDSEHAAMIIALCSPLPALTAARRVESRGGDSLV